MDTMLAPVRDLMIAKPAKVVQRDPHPPTGRLAAAAAIGCDRPDRCAGWCRAEIFMPQGKFAKGSPAGNGGVFPCPKSYKVSRSFTAETLQLRTNPGIGQQPSTLAKYQFGLFCALANHILLALTEKLA
jgi:hypothetical protein